ncbi:universal stress protein [Halosimplex amylolyticum]|uniref:universal stress protein n=1 Tax=Halosimplex amylolyticum TaxID=3396616 RepID=UPI003F55985C
MFDRILVPVDGSEASDRAVRYALALADDDTTVRALAVVDRSAVPERSRDSDLGDRIEASVRETAQSALDEATEACDDADVAATGAIAVGHPTEEIVEYASANEVDLVVIGAHARGRLARFLRRSVARQVAQHSTMPVLIVRADGPDIDRGIRRILLATDGSESAQHARDYAFGLAAAHDATVYGLYVVDSRFGSTGALHAVLEQQGEAIGDALRARGAQDGVDVAPETREGEPERVILEFADDQDVDLIVVGTHGRTGLDRFVMGSVATAVVRGASRPVLTVRTRARE